MSELRPRLVLAFLNRLLADGMHPATVRKVRTVLSSVLSFAVAMEYLDSNPVMKVAPPEVGPSRRMAPTLEETARILRVAERDDPEFYVYLWVACEEGGRRGETLALRWCDVDLDAGTITIPARSRPDPTAFSTGCGPRPARAARLRSPASRSSSCSRIASAPSRSSSSVRRADCEAGPGRRSRATRRSGREGAAERGAVRGARAVRGEQVWEGVAQYAQACPRRVSSRAATRRGDGRQRRSGDSRASRSWAPTAVGERCWTRPRVSRAPSGRARRRRQVASGPPAAAPQGRQAHPGTRVGARRSRKRRAAGDAARLRSAGVA